MLVLVDTNERDSNDKHGRKKHLERIQTVFPEAKAVNLKVGDVNIVLDDGSIIAVERKTAGDFVGSIADGHIFRQVEAMNDNAKWSCVVVEGSIKFDKKDMVVTDGRETNWKGVSVRGAQYAIMWSGCPILPTTVERYPWTLLEIAKFCTKPEQHVQSLGHKRIVTFPPVELDTEILSAFPGVGIKKAKSLQQFAMRNSEREVGGLAESLAWASCFPLLEKTSLPEGWGTAMAANLRATLGLAPWEFLDIKEDKQLKEKYEVQEKKRSRK